MKRGKSANGFSILEVILAAALFIILATGAVTIVINGYNSNRLGQEMTVANQFAAEGIEAMKSIKNQAYTTLTACPAGPATNGVVRDEATFTWKCSGSDNTLTHNSGDDFIRTIKIEDVQRDDAPPAGNIVASGGTLDPDTKKVTSTVTWNFSAARPETISLVSYLSDWRKPISSGGSIMMAYSKTTTTPFYRIWDGANWSAEGSAQVVGGNINYIVLKSSRTRNEAILGTLDSNGNIYAQVWNGTDWATPILMANVTATNSTTRSFDLDYEKSSDRAIFAYLPTSTSTDFAYRIWDGASWSAANTITTPPTTGVVKWLDVTQNPVSSSNEVALIMLDANIDVYGMAWDGTSWGNMGDGAVWDASAAIDTEKVTDVAYEQISGRAMFIWGDATATDQYYRIWNGSTLTAATLLDIPAAGGVANWIEIVPRPSSNELMYGVLDAGSDLNTRKWSGSAWDTAAQHPEHTAGAENNSSMVFDLIWETHTSFSSGSGKAWILWGNGKAVSAKPWTGAWESAATLAGSDDTSFIRLKADPTSGAVFAGIYQNVSSAVGARDINERRLTGGSEAWTTKNIIWGGPTSAEPVHFRIDIAIP